MNLNESDDAGAVPALAASSGVNISNKATKNGLPTTQAILAHLKLLEALYALKDEVAYTDGLFGLFDNRAHGSEASVAGDPDATRRRLESLAAIREKRWLLYVARAALRYECWWTQVLEKMDATCARNWDTGIGPVTALTTSKMATDFGWFDQFTAIEKFGIKERFWEWTPDLLPPLDVLMVFHTHMLNPRNFLADCLRDGFRSTWHAGMPWKAVDECIDERFQYNVPEAAKYRWTEWTQRPWDQFTERLNRSIACPRCKKIMSVPWTSTSRPETSREPWVTDDPGSGFAEAGFSVDCDKCKQVISHDTLRLGRFKSDVQYLLTTRRPLKGTIVPGVKGLPQSLKAHQGQKPWMFPNKLFQGPLKFGVLTMMTIDSDLPISQKCGMQDLKKYIESSLKIRSTVAALRNHDQRPGRIWNEERLAVRQMMGAYWDNHSYFSMDLSSAVIRQASFVDKMHRLDWQHSPNATDICQRIIEKYRRFIQMVALNPGRTVVPTLDVDLGWHTHQLSPKQYFTYSVEKTGDRFIDHDDKIGEDKLNTAFEWTSKEYEKRYKEVYSECTCWYCESIRARHVSTISKLFNDDKHDKVADEFYSSGRAKLCPPEKGAHISTHNSMPAYSTTDPVYQVVQDRYAARARKVLEESFEKACKRAKKRGRPLPERKKFEEEHFGYKKRNDYPYVNTYNSPFMYPYGLYYIPMGTGSYGACAAGTCGGTVAAGECADGSDCGGGCTASAGCGYGGKLSDNKYIRW